MHDDGKLLALRHQGDLDYNDLKLLHSFSMGDCIE